jgi:hypothetical protein
MLWLKAEPQFFPEFAVMYIKSFHSAAHSFVQAAVAAQLKSAAVSTGISSYTTTNAGCNGNTGNISTATFARSLHTCYLEPTRDN